MSTSCQETTESFMLCNAAATSEWKNVPIFQFICLINNYSTNITKDT